MKKAKKAQEKVTFGQKMRGFNILFPWAKVAIIVIVLMTGFVVWEVVRYWGVEGEVAKEVTAEKIAVGEGADDEIEDDGMKGESERLLNAETKDDGEAGMEDEDSLSVTRKGVIYVMAKPTKLRWRSLKDKKLIALTFDDGPTWGTTVRLLDILKEKKAKVTFFVVGRMAQAAPEVLRRMEQAGHAVGSHTMGHVNLAKMDIEKIRQDKTEIDAVFQGILGRTTNLIRPPYGELNENVKTGVGQPLVIWTIDPEDWRTKDANKIRKHVVEKAFDGAIVLMHDIYETTVDAVGGMIDDLRKNGYELVTVPEMARVRGVTLEKGGIYGSFRP